MLGHLGPLVRRGTSACLELGNFGIHVPRRPPALTTLTRLWGHEADRSSSGGQGRSPPRSSWAKHTDGRAPAWGREGDPVTIRVMALDPRTPVLVGVGQVTERPDQDRPVAERVEPVELMARALEAASADCGGDGSGDRLLDRAQSLRIMVPLSWRYINPALLVADRLGLAPAELALTSVGGNSPQTVASVTAQAIAGGDLDVALMAGAECIYTASRHDAIPNTRSCPGRRSPPRRLSRCGSASTARRSPRWNWPLASTGPSTSTRCSRTPCGPPRPRVSTNIRRRCRSCGPASPRSPPATRMHGPANHGRPRNCARSVPPTGWCRFPTPSTSTPTIESTRGPPSSCARWKPLAGPGCRRTDGSFPFPGPMPTITGSFPPPQPAFLSRHQARRGEAALRLAGVGIDDVAHIDLYSCFPCAVQIAADELGLLHRRSPTVPSTVTGGLAFARGARQQLCQSFHRHYRPPVTPRPRIHRTRDRSRLVCYKTSVGLWSTTPPSHGFVFDSPQAQIDALPQRAPASDFEGDTTVETYTVLQSGRDGEPQKRQSCPS